MQRHQPCPENPLPDYEARINGEVVGAVPLQTILLAEPRRPSRTRPGPAQTPLPALTRTTQSPTGPSDEQYRLQNRVGTPILLRRAVDPTHVARFRVMLKHDCGYFRAIHTIVVICPKEFLYTLPLFQKLTLGHQPPTLPGGCYGLSNKLF
jgi:hypothetical protein